MGGEVSSNNNSISGGYGVGGGSLYAAPITYTNKNTSVTPSVSHVLNESSHSFGGGCKISHNHDNTNISGSFHSHGKSNSFSAGVTHNINNCASIGASASKDNNSKSAMISGKIKF